MVNEQTARRPGWRSLAHAVIIQAVDDLALCRVGVMPRNLPHGTSMERAAGDAERFLRSEWCYSLGGVDGSTLVRAARARSEEALFRKAHGCARCRQYMHQCPHHYHGEHPYTEMRRWKALEKKRGRLHCYKEAHGRREDE